MKVASRKCKEKFNYDSNYIDQLIWAHQISLWIEPLTRERPPLPSITNERQAREFLRRSTQSEDAKKIWRKAVEIAKDKTKPTSGEVNEARRSMEIELPDEDALASTPKEGQRLYEEGLQPLLETEKRKAENHPSPKKPKEKPNYKEMGTGIPEKKRKRASKKKKSGEEEEEAVEGSEEEEESEEDEELNNYERRKNNSRNSSNN